MTGWPACARSQAGKQSDRVAPGTSDAVLGSGGFRYHLVGAGRIPIEDEQIAAGHSGDEPLLPRDAEALLGAGVRGLAGRVDLTLEGAGSFGLAGENRDDDARVLHG